MKRLTKYSEINKDYITPYCDGIKCDGCCRDCDYEQVIINKLAEYENTGLEPEEVEQLKNAFDKLVNEIDLLRHGKDYRFRNADNTFYSRESCKNLMLEETVEELSNELYDINKSLEDFENNDDKLKHDLAVYKIVADKSYEAMSNMRLLIADNVIRDNYFVSKEKLIDQAEKELKGK